jgi:hypothetical protein
MTPHDQGPPRSPRGGEPAGDRSAPKRGGTQKRKRDRRWPIALDEQEEAAALQGAAEAELSKMAYGRAMLLGSPGPRSRRKPHVNAQLLGHAIAQLKRAGNVANQIAHRLNAAQSVGGSEAIAALADIREAARAIRDAAGYKERNDHQGEPPR